MVSLPQWLCQMLVIRRLPVQSSLGPATCKEMDHEIFSMIIPFLDRFLKNLSSKIAMSGQAGVVRGLPFGFLQSYMLPLSLSFSELL